MQKSFCHLFLSQNILPFVYNFKQPKPRVLPVSLDALFELTMVGGGDLCIVVGVSGGRVDVEG